MGLRWSGRVVVAVVVWWGVANSKMSPPAVLAVAMPGVEMMTIWWSSLRLMLPLFKRDSKSASRSSEVWPDIQLSDISGLKQQGSLSLWVYLQSLWLSMHGNRLFFKMHAREREYRGISHALTLKSMLKTGLDWTYGRDSQTTTRPECRSTSVCIQKSTLDQ